MTAAALAVVLLLLLCRTLDNFQLDMELLDLSLKGQGLGGDVTMLFCPICHARLNVRELLLHVCKLLLTGLDLVLQGPCLGCWRLLVQHLTLETPVLLCCVKQLFIPWLEILLVELQLLARQVQLRLQGVWGGLRLGLLCSRLETPGLWTALSLGLSLGTGATLAKGLHWGRPRSWLELLSVARLKLALALALALAIQCLNDGRGAFLALGLGLAAAFGFATKVAALGRRRERTATLVAEIGPSVTPHPACAVWCLTLVIRNGPRECHGA